MNLICYSGIGNQDDLGIWIWKYKIYLKNVYITAHDKITPAYMPVLFYQVRYFHPYIP